MLQYFQSAPSQTAFLAAPSFTARNWGTGPLPPACVYSRCLWGLLSFAAENFLVSGLPWYLRSTFGIGTWCDPVNGDYSVRTFEAAFTLYQSNVDTVTSSWPAYNWVSWAGPSYSWSAGSVNWAWSSGVRLGLYPTGGAVSLVIGSVSDYPGGAGWSGNGYTNDNFHKVPPCTFGATGSDMFNPDFDYSSGIGLVNGGAYQNLAPPNGTPGFFVSDTQMTLTPPAQIISGIPYQSSDQRGPELIDALVSNSMQTTEDAIRENPLDLEAFYQSTKTALLAHPFGADGGISLDEYDWTLPPPGVPDGRYRLFLDAADLFAGHGGTPFTGGEVISSVSSPAAAFLHSSGPADVTGYAGFSGWEISPIKVPGPWGGWGRLWVWRWEQSIPLTAGVRTYGVALYRRAYQCTWARSGDFFNPTGSVTGGVLSIVTDSAVAPDASPIALPMPANLWPAGAPVQVPATRVDLHGTVIAVNAPCWEYFYILIVGQSVTSWAAANGYVLTAP